MHKRRLGRTDIEITPIGLGCWQFSGSGGAMGLQLTEAERARIDELSRAASR